MIKDILTGTGRVFFSLFCAVFIYAVGVTVFVKSLTQDNEYALSMSTEAKAAVVKVAERQTQVEVGIIQQISEFNKTMNRIEVELQYIRRELDKGKR